MKRGLAMMRNLKGWAALALSAAMVVSMGACGTSDKTDSQASVDSNSSSTTGYDVSGVKKDEKKEEEPAAKAEEPKTVEAAEVPAAKEEQKEEKPSYDPEIK